MPAGSKRALHELRRSPPGQVSPWLPYSSSSVRHSCFGIYGTKNETPKVPIQMHFGDKDMHIPMTHVNELRKLHPAVQIFDYPADHGFHCDERGSYDAAASKQAMARTLEFFGKHVG